MQNERRFVYRESLRISRGDMQLAKQGQKKCTIRLGTASVATPEMQLSDGRQRLSIRIIRVDNDIYLRDLTDQHARDEGFRDRAELLADLRHYYPSAQDDDVVTVIYFEVLDENLELF